MFAMTPIGHGIDITEVDRIAQMLERHGERFTRRVFTAAERRYCEANPRRRAEHYAARFAAKEAVLKAIGTGWRAGIAWTDIQVTRGDNGEPSLQICGQVRRIADIMGIDRWLVSLTHTATVAQASVIAIGRGGAAENT